MYKLFKISINYFVYNNRSYIPLFASGIVAMEAITITTRAQTLRCRTYKQDVFQEEQGRGSGRPSLVTTWRQKTKERTELMGTCRNPKRGVGHSVETPKRDQISAGRRGVVMWDLLNWRFLFNVQSTVPTSSSVYRWFLEESRMEAERMWRKSRKKKGNEGILMPEEPRTMLVPSVKYSCILVVWF